MHNALYENDGTSSNKSSEREKKKLAKWHLKINTESH